MRTDKPIRVLVVDDEPLVRDLLVSYLNGLGFAVETAQDGLEGLEKYTGGDFDLVITDLSMPNMDGIELVKELREIDDEAVVLIITGYPTIGTAVEAIKQGAADYITKPFTLDEVKIRIDKAIGAKTLKGRLKSAQGLAWGLLFSIPLWLVIGIVLAWIFK
jgi:two-component system response regulator PilR (NtrC family)